jgi:mannose-1-phosphate guanylyltransferase
MCGGIGSRFWPSSRQAYPKQFIDFMGTGRSLLQMTYDRIRPLVPAENIVVVTNATYAEQIRTQLPDLKPESILLEPARRNTAPCIAWAAHHIKAIDPEASMIVTPADHLITREVEFQRMVSVGFDFVEKNDALLTLGIKPNHPETGYGYIQMGHEVSPNVLKVKTFTEKPNLELAKVFLSSGEFVWNSGIFLWSVDAVLKGLEAHAPEIESRFARGEADFGTPREADFIAREFAACPGDSIDYALMEKASNVYVERVDIGWSDLGTWSSLHELSPKTAEGNVTQGCHVLSYGTTGSIFNVSNREKLVVADGLKDYIVADSDDVLLICPLANEQHIKQYVNDVKQLLGEKYI